MGKHYSVVILVLLLFGFGCSTPEKYDKPLVKITQEELLLADQVPVFGIDGVVVSQPMRDMIYTELARFPKSHKHIGGIAVVLRMHSDRGALLGLWDDRVMLLTVAPVKKVQKTLWHELAHVHTANLSKAQMDAWGALYQKYIEKSGYNFGELVFGRPMPVEPTEGFPTLYSMTNVQEFIAENMEYYMTNPLESEKNFSEAYKKLVEDGFMPIN